jgi:hypothetical protein
MAIYDSLQSFGRYLVEEKYNFSQKLRASELCSLITKLVDNNDNSESSRNY